MVAPGDAIPSEPGRQVTAEDNVERNNREAEKNATKASLNLQATAGGTPAVPTSKDSGQNHLTVLATLERDEACCPV